MPKGRTGHTTAIYKGHLIMFGGIYEITRELNDMFAFNLQTKVWTRLFRASNEDNLGASQKLDGVKNKKTRRSEDSPDNSNVNKMNTMLSRQSTKKVEQKKPAKIRSPKAAEEPVNLESPTSVTMKQSFLLKQSDKEFESYWNIVKKKKDGQPACAQAFGLFPPVN